MKKNIISRRNFLQNTALTAGMTAIAPIAIAGDLSLTKENKNKSSHEVWIAGVSMMGLGALRGERYEKVVEKMKDILSTALVYDLDFVCLPEIFPYAFNHHGLSLSEMLEGSNKVLGQFSEFSKQNSCYTVCPVYTSSDGRIYNSAVVFDRTGKKIGQYDKIHETVEEVAKGVTCGALFQPVIQTEFGPIGIQICYDINFEEGWKMLREQGAKIIFWPSAFDGGKQINMKALQNKCVMVSSTWKNVSKACDISGETVAQTGIWEPNLYCTPINMEKVFLPAFDYLQQCEDMKKKYGGKVKITIFHEEEWTIVEAVSRDIFIKDIIKEYNLVPHFEGIREAEIIQNKSRV